MVRELLSEISKQHFREYLHGFSNNIWKSFIKTIRWPWIILHLLAIGISIPLVIYGIDWSYYLFFRNHLYLQVFLFPAVSLGGLIPFFLPPLLYLYGKKENRPELEPLAYSLTQVAVLGLFWSSFYKAITGRMGPELFEPLENGDFSTDFAFGFIRRGVFHGWPSGHTTIAWGMAVVFYLYWERFSDNHSLDDIDNSLIRFSIKYRKYALLYAFYIGFGVSTNIHWLTDAIAGTLVGITVGRSVASNYEFSDGELEGKNLRSVFFILFMILIFTIIGFDDIL